MQTQADYISSAFPGIDGHAISLFTAKKAIGYTAALTKSILHGIVRGAINVIQSGGKFLSSFASGFVSSAFSVGKKTFGEGAVAARTAIMALVGGVTSELTGGKFLNGAVSAAFVHLFNTERGRWSYPKKGHFKGEEHHNGSYYMKNGTRISDDGRFMYVDASPYTVHQDSNVGTYILVGAVAIPVVVLGGELVMPAYYWVAENPWVIEFGIDVISSALPATAPAGSLGGAVGFFGGYGYEYYRSHK